MWLLCNRSERTLTSHNGFRGGAAPVALTP